MSINIYFNSCAMYLQQFGFNFDDFLIELMGLLYESKRF